MKLDEKLLLSRWLKSMLLVVLVSLLLGGAGFYRYQEQAMHRRVVTDLQAIAQLKADQIVAWRRDQSDDAALLQEHRFLRENVARFLADPNRQNHLELRDRLRILARQHHYVDILLVAPDGTVLLRLLPATGRHDGYLAPLNEALETGKPVFSDLYSEPSSGAPHLSVIVPLRELTDHARGPCAALVLINDASHFLYPLIQSWPTPSNSSETVLVRQDGDEVLFLNDRRRQPDTALKLRIPLTRTEVPAVMAVQGKTGFVQGLDSRGVAVASVILPLPGSPWFMIAKIDRAEIFADWHFRSALIVALLLGVTICIGTGGLFLWQRNKKSHYRSLFLSEAARRMTAERHSVTLRSIGDAVIATDHRGLVELLNQVAEELTGRRQDEAHGRPLEEVLRIIDEHTREKVEDPVAKVLREGVVVVLANRSLLVTRDGTEFPIAGSGAPIRDETDTIIGVVLLFRDRTFQKHHSATARLRPPGDQRPRGA